MKKRILLTLILTLVALVCGCLFAACGDIAKQIDQTLNLSAPENVKYDGATISWNAVENADAYSVRINDGSEYSVTVPSYPYTNTANTQFNVTVKAVSNSKLVQSAETVKTFSPIEAVTNITIAEDGTLVWDAVNVSAGSIEYVVKVDGQELPPVTATQYTISSFGEGRHSIQIRPTVAGNDSYYSKWSDVKTVTVLGSVSKERITYTDGIIKWPTVQNAASYDIYINGAVVEENYDATSYEFDAQSSSFDIAVKARGNNTTTFDGALSEAKSFVYLGTVTNVLVEDGILRWDEVEGASGYKIKLNGTVQSVTLKECGFANLTAGRSTDIQIMPISSSETYFSEWSAVKSVLILESPIIKWNSDYELDGDANSNAYWDAIANAAGYAVRLTLPDGTQQISTYGETQRAYQEAYLQVGKYTVEVKAVASTSSNSVYDSLYSSPITVTRLYSPKAASRNYITSNADDVTEGFTVTYQTVVGASGYVLYRDNNEIMRGVGSQFEVRSIIDSSVTAEQTYNFKIASLGHVESKNGVINVTLGSLTEESLAFKIEVLATPTNPYMSGFEYFYGSVSGNNGYTIDVQGQSFTSGGTSYDLSNLEAGVYNVSVCAKGNGTDVLASNYSQPISVHRLSAPTNIRVETSDASEGVLTYNTVEHATGYYVVFDNDGTAVPVETIKNMNQYVTEQGTTVYMVSTANQYNSDNTIYYMESQPSTTANMIKLKAPTFGDVTFSNTQLIWKASANMNTAVYTPTYEVYAANKTKYNGEKNGTTMDISYLEGGAEYTFTVKAIGNGTNFINSEESSPVTIYKLATPQVERKDGKYVWSSVVDATSYVVYVDGVLKATYAHEPGKTYEYTPLFNELKTYTVEVYAIGDGGNQTIDSQAQIIKQATKQLSTPDFTFSYSNAYYIDTGTINVTVTDIPAYASGFSYKIGGVTNTSKESTYSHLPSSVGTFAITVYALGGAFDESGVYYLDSQAQGGSSSYSITLLATPNESSIELSQDGKLSWTTISNAVGYEIEISVDGADYGEIIYVSTSSYVLTNFSQYSGKSIKVRIRAKGNGTKIVSSQTVEKEWNNL